MRQVSALSILAAIVLYGQMATSGIQGTVVDQTGAPIPGAVVTYQRAISYAPRLPGQSGWIPTLAPGEVELNGSVWASASGAFQTPNLPPGTYGVFAYHPTEPYLDPCLWGPPLTITPPGTAGRGNIVLSKGVFLRVHVNDPSGLLAQPSLMRSDLTFGVMFGTGGFRAAACVPSATGRDCAIIVPANQPLQSWVWSGDYALSGEDGSPIPASGKAFPFQAATGVDQVFTFTVTGKLLSQTQSQAK